MTADEIQITVDHAASEDPIFTVEIETPRGSLFVMAEVSYDARSMRLEGMHLGGDARITWGAKTLKVNHTSGDGDVRCRRDRRCWSGSDNGCKSGTSLE